MPAGGGILALRTESGSTGPRDRADEDPPAPRAAMIMPCGGSHRSEDRSRRSDGGLRDVVAPLRQPCRMLPQGNARR